MFGSAKPGGPGRARRWLPWTLAVGVYMFSVFHRSSLGVAGLAATSRFGIGPAELSMFTVLQVAVYATMQIPTGVLVDRFGPRAMLTVSAGLLAAGEVAFGLTHSFAVALLARGVVGCGDAMVWISVLRVAAGTFQLRRYPLIVVISSALGSVGNLVATTPLTLLLHAAGWTATFVGVGLVTACWGAVVAAGPRVPPHREPAVAAAAAAGVVRQVRVTWRMPQTRLAFWVHFTTMATPTTLTLLWGYPYLVRGDDLTAGHADALLALLVVGAIVAAPVIGTVTSRHRFLRMPMVATYVPAVAALWGVLLSWPGRAPFGLLAFAFAMFAFGGPMSTVGFALARDYNPLTRVGAATGVVNVGGFVATTLASLGMGVLVDLLGDGPGAYRASAAAVPVVMAAGGWRVAVWWRRARARTLATMAAGESVPVVIRRRRWDAPPMPAAEPASA
jgi:MFS family permease